MTKYLRWASAYVIIILMKNAITFEECPECSGTDDDCNGRGSCAGDAWDFDEYDSDYGDE